MTVKEMKEFLASLPESREVAVRCNAVFYDVSEIRQGFDADSGPVVVIEIEGFEE